MSSIEAFGGSFDVCTFFPSLSPSLSHFLRAQSLRCYIEIYKGIRTLRCIPSCVEHDSTEGIPAKLNCLLLILSCGIYAKMARYFVRFGATNQMRERNELIGNAHLISRNAGESEKMISRVPDDDASSVYNASLLRWKIFSRVGLKNSTWYRLRENETTTAAVSRDAGSRQVAASGMDNNRTKAGFFRFRRNRRRFHGVLESGSFFSMLTLFPSLFLSILLDGTRSSL